MMDLTLHIAIAAATGLIAGFVAGLSHFASLAWNVRLFVDGSTGKAVALQLARLALTVVVMTLLVQLGPFALLAGAAGFVAARAGLAPRLGGLR